MATQEEQNFITKTRNEFTISVDNAIREIQNKFSDFHTQLHQRENNLIDYVEEIQKDILQKFDEITPKLKEIQQCRDSTISILTNNTNKQLLETQLHSFTTEIEGVIGQSGIDNLIRLKWKYCELQVDNICEVLATNSSKPKPIPDFRIYNSDQVTKPRVQPVSKKQGNQNELMKLAMARKHGIKCKQCLTHSPITARVCLHCGRALF